MEYYSPRQFIECLLPDHYEVSESFTGRIVCRSSTGIEDESKWDWILSDVKNHFGLSFKEVHHWTCYHHKSFTIYYDYHLYTPKSSAT